MSTEMDIQESIGIPVDIHEEASSYEEVTVTVIIGGQVVGESTEADQREAETDALYQAGIRFDDTCSQWVVA